MKILEFIFAVFLFIPVSLTGIGFNIIFFYKFDDFFMYFINLAFEIVEVVYDLFRQFALIIDRLGNVVAGGFFEWFVTGKIGQKNTPFGLSGWTISASTGFCLHYEIAINRGVRFSKFLSKILREPNHCEIAYDWKLYVLKFKNNEHSEIQRLISEHIN